MTTEEKAKAYDGAIKKLRDFYRDYDTVSCLIDVKDELANLFPELKESEDDENKRISKEITQFLKQNNGWNREWLAWLEKQGKQEEPQVYETEDGETITYSETDGYKVVEPKFKKGDWVIDKQGIVHQIANVIENVTYHTYGYDIVGGGYFNDNTEGVRLWTIQDAKDGDVLAESKRDVILMFRRIGNTEWDDVIDYHCYYDCYRKGFIVQEGAVYWGDTENCQLKPTTKEQRDTLERAMANAGFTFDFDKKELKKIEQNVQLTEFEEAVKDLMNDYRDAIGDNDATVEEVKEHAAYMLSLIHQNTAWSKEDEDYFDAIMAKLEVTQDDALLTGNQMKFLKSLKNKVQSKQEWSEEDEKRAERLLGWLDTLVNYIHHDAVVSLDLRRERMQQVEQLKTWLKSLKDRY